MSATDPLGLICLSKDEINAIVGLTGGGAGGAATGRSPQSVVGFGLLGGVIGGAAGYGSSANTEEINSGLTVLGAVSSVFDTNATNIATSGVGALLGEYGMRWMAESLGISKPVANVIGSSGGAAFGAGAGTFLTGPVQRGRGWVKPSVVGRTAGKAATTAAAATGTAEGVRAILEKINDCKCPK